MATDASVAVRQTDFFFLNQFSLTDEAIEKTLIEPKTCLTKSTKIRNFRLSRRRIHLGDLVTNF